MASNNTIESAPKLQVNEHITTPSISSSQPILSNNCAKKRKTSVVWNDFEEVQLADGVKKAMCLHCKGKLSTGGKGASTSHLKRHLEICLQRKFHISREDKQTTIPFCPLTESEGNPFIVPDSKYSNEKIGEIIASSIMVHERPFSNNTIEYAPELQVNEDITIPSISSSQPIQSNNSATEVTGGDEDSIITNKPRKTSVVWNDFEEVQLADGVKKAICLYCKGKLSTGSTSHLKRHLEICLQRKLHISQENKQTMIPFRSPTESEGQSSMDYDKELECALKGGAKTEPGTKQKKTVKLFLMKTPTQCVTGPSSQAQLISVVSPTPSEQAQAKAHVAGKRPVGARGKSPPNPDEEVESTVKRARQQIEDDFADTLARGSSNIREMFDFLFQLNPPPPSPLAETVGWIGERFAKDLTSLATMGTELFMRAYLGTNERDQEIKKLREELDEKDAVLADREVELDKWRKYPGSSEFKRDAFEYAVNHSAELASSLCTNESSILALVRALNKESVGAKVVREIAAWGFHRGKKFMQASLHGELREILPDDWEQVRPLLPDDLEEAGPPPYADSAEPLGAPQDPPKT